MRAEAVSWDDWSVSNAPPVIDEDKWHVALAPGEVKIVSLEQLDDLFRLSIVDAETKVWQDGMTEWQPLRVIAGLEDEPAPEPKRSYPKPPSPRSAPPSAPPAPRSVSPAPRSAPPPPRSVSPAPRSAPPPPRPKSVAPTPSYAAPLSLAQTQPAFFAPVAPVNQFASVRPLVVSQRPRAVKQGGGFGRFLLGLAVVTGLVVSLYRNGLVSDAAEAAHQPALYARLEAALGGPAFGTLRAIELSHTAAALALPSLNSALPTPEAGEHKTAAAQHVAPPPASLPQSHSGPPPVSPPVVSLESLAPEKANSARAKADAPSAPAVAAPAPPRSVVQAKAEPAVAAPPKALPVAEKKAPVEKAKPAVVEKSESEMSERERLNAAIGRSMLSSPPTGKAAKAKGAKGNADYDPLNPKL